MTLTRFCANNRVVKKLRVLSIFLSLALIFGWLFTSYSPVRAYITQGVSAGQQSVVIEDGTPSQPLPGAILQSQSDLDSGKNVDALSTASVFTHAVAGTFALSVFPDPKVLSGQAKGPDHSFIGFFTNSLVSMIGNPPASSSQYIAYLNDKVSVPTLVAPAYAANGIGYDSLNPILKVWEISRNIAYLALTIIFVVIAFMIMFRVKIDPKTVASLQNALPKIFLAIILIYFSYAIAGLLIDLMYVLIGLILNLSGTLATGSAKDGITSIQNGLPTDNLFGIFGADKFISISTSTAAAFGEIVSNLLGSGDGAPEKIAGFLTSAVAWVVIAGALVFALFKTWFALLNAYIQIILGVISAPIFLMFEALPGRSVVGIWLRNMASNLLVFPFTILMIMVGVLLSSGWTDAATAGKTAFIPPLIGGNSIGAIQALIGLAIILTMPKGINILQEFIKAPPFKYGNAWAESFQGGLGMAKGGVNQGANFTGVPQARQLVNQAQTSRRTQEMLGGQGWRKVFSPIVKGLGPNVTAADIQDLTKIGPKP